MSFNDKVVIVTGASSGVGAATAVKFASEGANVAMVGSNETKLKYISEKCERAGNKPLIIIAELTKDDDLKRIINSTITHFGKLNVLVNNAETTGKSNILDENVMEFFDKVYATNLRSIVTLVNLAGPHLIETKGNIVNVSSVAAMRVQAPEAFAYSCSKAGLDQFTKCIALDLGAKGVRVNVVSLGPVKTDVMINAGMDVAVGDTPNISDKMAFTTALNRSSEPEETADVILFLASDKAVSVTGTCYVSDNGMLLKNNFM